MRDPAPMTPSSLLDARRTSIRRSSQPVAGARSRHVPVQAPCRPPAACSHATHDSENSRPSCRNLRTARAEFPMSRLLAQAKHSPRDAGWRPSTLLPAGERLAQPPHLARQPVERLLLPAKRRASARRRDGNRRLARCGGSILIEQIALRHAGLSAPGEAKRLSRRRQDCRAVRPIDPRSGPQNLDKAIRDVCLGRWAANLATLEEIRELLRQIFSR